MDQDQDQQRADTGQTDTSLDDTLPARPARLSRGRRREDVTPWWDVRRWRVADLFIILGLAFNAGTQLTRLASMEDWKRQHEIDSKARYELMQTQLLTTYEPRERAALQLQILQDQLRAAQALNAQQQSEITRRLEAIENRLR